MVWPLWNNDPVWVWGVEPSLSAVINVLLKSPPAPESIQLIIPVTEHLLEEISVEEADFHVYSAWPGPWPRHWQQWQSLQLWRYQSFCSINPQPLSVFHQQKNAFSWLWVSIWHTAEGTCLRTSPVYRGLCWYWHSSILNSNTQWNQFISGESPGSVDLVAGVKDCCVNLLRQIQTTDNIYDL